LRFVTTTLCAACGIALLAAARAMDYAWFERHVLLPSFYPWAPAWVPGDVRAAVAIAGVVLLAAAWPAGRALRRATPAGIARLCLALLLALGVSELLLRRGAGPTAKWRASKLEFRIGRVDPLFGWVLFPGRATPVGPPAHQVTFAVDDWGDRAARPGGAPDRELRSLVIAGESIAAGHGVEYEQTFASLLGNDLGLQVVNTGCGGYAADQALLRLRDVLGRLRRPVAVVTTFVPVMLQRSRQDYRPRLVLRGGELHFVPPADGFLARLRLRDLVVNEMPWLGDDALREATRLNAAILRETARVTREHGAEPLFVAISIGAPRTLDQHPEAALLRELFADQGLPYVLVDVAQDELLPWDGHPNAAAHARIARAVEAALRPRLSRAQ
jgi:lysophospholipase L1-like esterase